MGSFELPRRIHFRAKLVEEEAVPAPAVTRRKKTNVSAVILVAKDIVAREQGALRFSNM